MRTTTGATDTTSYDKYEIEDLNTLSSGVGESSLVLHDLKVKDGKEPCQHVRLYIRRPATQFGTSLWRVGTFVFASCIFCLSKLATDSALQLEIFGFGRRGGCNEKSRGEQV